MGSHSASERGSANIARLQASRLPKFGAEVVRCGSGSSDVTSDAYPEPMKSAVAPILIKGVGHAYCNLLQLRLPGEGVGVAVVRLVMGRGGEEHGGCREWTVGN